MSKLAKALTAAAGNAGDSLYVEDVFSTYLYTGTASAITINNGLDLSGEGGLTWLKSRSLAEAHILMDTARGVSSAIVSSNSNAAFTLTDGITAFNSNGFTLGTSNITNTNASTNVSWSFRKAKKFFDVVTYTGDGNATKAISHNLGSTPGFIVVKRTNGTGYWIAGHNSDYTKYLMLNETNGFQTWTGNWNATDSAFTAYSSGNASFSLNNSGDTYVAYLFASDAGGFGDDENIIKCGSYTGNGSTDGPTIDCGFEPQWLLIKNVTDGGNWLLMDAMRGMPVGDEAAVLVPNASGDEPGYANIWGVDLQATGFKVNVSNIQINESGGTMVYIAIRRPMKTPESGTEVFTTRVATEVEYNNTVDYGITTDLLLNRYNKSGSQYTMPFDRMRGSSKILYTSLTDAEGTLTLGTGNKGFGASQTSVTWPQIANSSTSNVTWAFKRATGFFDVVAYTGNSTGNTAITHNLGVVPEIIITKPRSGADNWAFWHKDFTQSQVTLLNNTLGAVTNSNYWGSSTPTATNFYVQTDGATNFSGYTYIAYLFATVAGVSKVGSYTGTGADLNVDCGFSAGARFILIKRTDSTGDWYVYDSARGITSGNDPYLLLNSTAAEVTSTDYIDPLASGFTVTSSAPAGLNASGGTYIFLAIA